MFGDAEFTPTSWLPYNRYSVMSESFLIVVNDTNFHASQLAYLLCLTLIPIVTHEVARPGGTPFVQITVYSSLPVMVHTVSGRNNSVSTLML